MVLACRISRKLPRAGHNLDARLFALAENESIDFSAIPVEIRAKLTLAAMVEQIVVWARMGAPVRPSPYSL
jgi:hypothetical protein